MRGKKALMGVRLDCGAARFKVRRRIQEHLDRLGLTQTDLARELGVSQQLVSGTISGGKNSPLVLARLRQLGVPEKYLHDPNLQMESRQGE